MSSPSPAMCGPGMLYWMPRAVRQSHIWQIVAQISINSTDVINSWFRICIVILKKIKVIHVKMITLLTCNLCQYELVNTRSRYCYNILSRSLTWCDWWNYSKQCYFSLSHYKMKQWQLLVTISEWSTMLSSRHSTSQHSQSSLPFTPEDGFGRPKHEKRGYFIIFIMNNNSN